MGLVLALGACSRPSERPENMGTSRSAITGADNDDDTPEANVVVALGSGGPSGILITPQIVLTAAHSLWGVEGSADDPCRASPTLHSVTIGLNPAVSARYKFPSVDHRSPAQCIEVGDESGVDFALLYLSEPVTTASLRMKGSLATMPPVPRVTRPALETPPQTGPYGPYPSTLGSAGYSDLFLVSPRVGNRQAIFVTNGFFWRESSQWRYGIDGWSTQDGDSGGPLFVRHADGRRDVVGVLSGWHSSPPWNSDYMMWADVTTEWNRSWILGNVRESNVPEHLRHTSTWLASHGKTLDDWWGELDYSGPCDSLHDFDCDGWYDQNPDEAHPIHDNCPRIANPDQRDSRDGGRGDACSLCPWDPGNDADGDGICAVGWPGNPFFVGDNCPLVKNGSMNNEGVPTSLRNQVNSNEEAEIVRRLQDPSIEILGDACDPVPVPRGAPVATLHTTPVGGVHPQFGGFITGRIKQGTIRTQHVAPHKKEPSGLVPETAVLNNISTSARFCQSNLQLLFDCHAPANIRDGALDDGEPFPIDPAYPWHRIKVLHKPTRGDSWPRTYDDTAGNHMWIYQTDYSFWNANGLIPEPRAYYYATCTNTALVGTGTCLEGTMWQHAESVVGKSTGWAGVPYYSPYVGIHGPDLANHYFDIAPDRAFARAYAGTGLMRKLFFLLPTLPDPAPYESVLRRRIRPLVAADLDEPPHVLEDHGGSWDAAEVLSPTLHSELMSYYGYDYVMPAEPYHLAGNMDRRVLGVLVSNAGDNLWDLAVDDHGTIRTASEMAGYLHVSEYGPPPRAGWVNVFSRTLAGVFFIGGYDPATGTPLHDVTLYRWGVGWTRIAEDFFDVARAATYSPADDKLWLLEQHHETVALHTVDPWTGEVHVAGSWTFDENVWDRHFLSVDADGTVLLVASSHSLDRTKVARVRLDANGEAYASQIEQEGLPYLSDAPIVDQDEYGFIVRDSSGAMTSIVRRSTIGNAPGTYSLAEMFE